MLGEISELTVASLGARQFNQTAESIILPGSRNQDHAQNYACDMLLIDIQSSKEQKLQVKTSRQSHYRDYYSSVIKIVAAQDLDPQNSHHPHRDSSLANAIIDEASGRADSSVVSRLDEANRRLKQTIDQQ